ncbi:MAG: transcriptional regulator PpsR [Methylocystis sp.]
MSDSTRSVTDLARLATPVESLGVADPETFGALLAACCDIVLVLDKAGVILDVAFGSADLAREAYRDWIGRSLVDTVTIESRPKIEELLRDAAPRAVSRWRQINYPARRGPDIPVRVAVIRSGPQERVIAVGRDLQAMASMQQRLADAQQSMEREYARIRGAEKRYRLLFQLASEAVLIVDLSNGRVVEVNPAGSALLGTPAKKIVGHEFSEQFDESSAQALRSFIAALKVAPRVDNVHVKLASTGEALLLSGSLFRQESASFLLVLLSRLDAPVALPAEKASILQIVEQMPDAFVLADAQRRILSANGAFVDLVQATTAERLKGESLERWIGRSAVDLDVIFANLRAHGVVTQFSTVLRGEYGSTEDVEISAVAALEGAEHCYGFTLRSAGWRSGAERLGGRELPRTAEQFMDLVGRVPLKNLVRETTDLVERLCIEAALKLTQDNRAAAAKMLSLSRQAFYAKLRRYGMGDLDDKDEGDEAS